MAWSSWFPMSRDAIQTIPEKGGVYELATVDTILYIGQSDNLRRRLLEHLASSDSCILRAKQFCYQESQNPEGFEEQVLSHYKNQYGKLPSCNELVS